MEERNKLKENEREKQTGIEIRVLELSEKILQSVILELAYKDSTVPRPRRADILGKYVYYRLRVSDVPKINRILEERLKSLEAQL